MICCPRGDISVELAGDTGIEVPPAEYHSVTARNFFGVVGAKPSVWNFSHRAVSLHHARSLTKAPIVLLVFVRG